MDRPCPHSLCTVDPELCSSSLSTSEYVQLAIIVTIPIAAAILLPILSSTYSRVSSHVNTVDPPMFGCGARLLPRECATSGLLVVAFVVIIGFLVVYVGLLIDPRPCETAMGMCGTISCMCGNVLKDRGYTWMFFSLVVTSLLLVREIATSMRGTTRRQRVNKGLMTTGAMLISLTGVFPEQFSTDLLREDRAVQDPWLLFGAFGLHLLGICVGTALLVSVPFVWHLREVGLPAWRQRQPGHLCLVGVRLVYIALTSLFTLLLGALVEFPDTTDYCAAIASRGECNAGWPRFDNTTLCNATLPAPQPEWPGDHFAGPKYTCGWVDLELSTRQRLLLPPAYVEAHAGICARRTCPLFAFARSTALEFAVLALAFTYLISFGLGDAKRLSLVAQPTPSASKPFMLLQPCTTSWSDERGVSMDLHETTQQGGSGSGVDAQNGPSPLQPAWSP